MPDEAPRSCYTLITGAGSGIGRGLAQRLAGQGALVLLAGRHAQALEEVRAELPGQGHLCAALDVTEPQAVADLFARLRADRTQLDGLVHCAGIHWLRPIQVTTAAQYREMLDSHLMSAFLLIKEAVGQRAFAREGGSIVLLSSAASLRGGAGSFAYASAKGGLVAGARVAAMELASRKIRVNVLLPGVVETPQGRRYLDMLSPDQQEALRKDHPLGLGTPRDVAAAAAFLLSPESRWITGTTLVVDGGLTAH